MKLERYRTFDGIMIHAPREEDEVLFSHCAGAYYVSERRLEEVKELLFIHGVADVEIVDHRSVACVEKE